MRLFKKKLNKVLYLTYLPSGSVLPEKAKLALKPVVNFIQSHLTFPGLNDRLKVFDKISILKLKWTWSTKRPLSHLAVHNVNVKLKPLFKMSNLNSLLVV